VICMRSAVVVAFMHARIDRRTQRLRKSKCWSGREMAESGFSVRGGAPRGRGSRNERRSLMAAQQGIRRRADKDTSATEPLVCVICVGNDGWTNTESSLLSERETTAAASKS
jgi:hypothetical protein